MQKVSDEILEQIRNSEFEQAKSHLLENLKTEPYNPASHFFLGVCNRQLNLLIEARDNYEYALQLKNNYAQALINLGAIYRMLCEWELAESKFEAALKLQPGLTITYYNMGLLYIQSENQPKYKEVLDILKRDDPEYEKLLIRFKSNFDRQN